MSVGFYIIFLWLPTYLGGFLNQRSGSILGVNTLSLIALIIFIPLAGHLSDKIGSIKLALFGSLLIVLLSLPLFLLMSQQSTVLLILGQMLFCLIFCVIEATMPKIMAEQFPSKCRFSGTAISYNIATSLFGGTAPLVCTLLIAKTKMFIMPGFYLVLCGFIGFCGYIIIFIRQKKVEQIR